MADSPGRKSKGLSRAPKWLAMPKAAIGITVAFLALSGADIYEAVRAHQTLSWPTTIATIRAHGVRIPAPWHAQWYGWRHATVTYDYQVNGQPFTCDRIRYQQPGDGRHVSEALSAARSNYPIGKTAEIHYDPAKPSRAVLLAAPADWSLVFRPWFILPVAALAIYLARRLGHFLVTLAQS